MTERQRGPGDIPTRERAKDIGTAMASSVVQKLAGKQAGEQKGARYSVGPAEVEALINDWPAGPTNAARQMMEQYGPPNEATPVRLIWYWNGPWKRTEVMRDEIVHNFPAPHTDYITNWINYHVPVERFSELARYDGSCLLDRTAGEAGARCDTEAANTITLNLMHEIVIGKRAVDEAREVYAREMSAYTLGRPAPYAERLLFDPPASGTMDPDKGMMAGAMAGQLVNKVLDKVVGEPPQGRDPDRSSQ